MTDHLPECKTLDVMPDATTMFHSTSRQWFWEHGCICDRLRACEQRVLSEAGDRVAAVFAGTWPGSPAYLLMLRHLRHSVIAAAMNEKP